MDKQIKQVEDKFKVLGLIPFIADKRKSRVLWRFNKPSFDVILNTNYGEVFVDDTRKPYKILSMTIQQISSDMYTIPVKYYNTVNDFLGKFGDEEIAYLRRRLRKNQLVPKQSLPT